MAWIHALAFLLAFCSLSFPFWEVGFASSHNLNISGFLLGAKNACNAAPKQPSEESIFSVAYARIVCLIPQSGTRTTDLADASVLWSWSADFPKKAAFLLPQGGACPPGQIFFHSPSAPSFSGAISYRYGDFVERIPLSSLGPNPASLNLSPSKIKSFPEEKPFSPLEIWLEGEIAVNFSFTKETYFLSCSPSSGGGVLCGCEKKVEAGVKTFREKVADNKSFFVENGGIYELWLNPPLASRLSGSEDAKIAFFTRRMPFRASFSSGESEIASFQFTRLSIKEGECGELLVDSKFMPQSSGHEASAGMGEPLRPFQLVERNASYLPFYIKFGWHEEAGTPIANLEIQDEFSNTFKFSKAFSVRSPSAFSPHCGECGSTQTRQANGSLSGAFFPPKAAQRPFPTLCLPGAALALLLAFSLCARA